MKNEKWFVYTFQLKAFLHVINDLLLNVKVDAFTEVVKVASVVVVNMNLV